jgi:phage shock protein PspC (stress-responsive transcriptional regulator)
MKKVQDVSVGGRNFFLDEDAYRRLDDYLIHFRSKLADTATSVSSGQNEEVMSDLESRIAELFIQFTGSSSRVVTLDMVDKVTSQLGMPDGSSEPGACQGPHCQETAQPVKKKIYRDMDERAVAGVCAGLAQYLDIDVVLVRVIAFVSIFAGTAGLWIYLFMWIAVPKAVTPVQKCEMYGLPATAENLRKYAQKK